LQQKIRHALCSLRRIGHYSGQPLRRPLRRSALLHVVVALLWDGALLRRLRLGKIKLLKKIKFHSFWLLLFFVWQLIITGLLMLCFGWRRNRFGYLVKKFFPPSPSCSTYYLHIEIRVLLPYLVGPLRLCALSWISCDLICPISTGDAHTKNI
jgi:hypothetical protein